MIGIYRTLGIVALIGVIIASIWYKINTLQTELLIANNRIVVLEQEIETMNVIAITNINTIAKQDISIKELSITIDNSNKDIVTKNNLLKEARLKLLEWSNKPPIIKYSTIYKYVKDINYTSATCTEGMELNLAITRINYDDL